MQPLNHGILAQSNFCSREKQQFEGISFVRLASEKEFELIQGAIHKLYPLSVVSLLLQELQSLF